MASNDDTQGHGPNLVVDPVQAVAAIGVGRAAGGRPRGAPKQARPRATAGPARPPPMARHRVRHSARFRAAGPGLASVQWRRATRRRLIRRALISRGSATGGAEESSPARAINPGLG
jgi:hypothetical protein